jgi:Domain of unknown function (DUF1707)
MADHLPDRIQRHELRAADADRERVAGVLRQAAAEGRLQLDELDERLSLVYAAKTYGELEVPLRDLPGTSSVPAPPVSRGGVAVMSEFKRQGRWSVSRFFTCFAFWGGGKIDLREAVFTDPQVKIRAVAIMGGIDVIVAEDANVHVTGLGIMGGFDHGASGTGAPGTPLIIVTGFAFWGGVTVKRKRRKIKGTD